MLDTLVQDVRQGWRGFRASPGFTLTAVLTLSLGIGATVAMFDVADRLMFRPLSYLHDPSSVHRIYWQWQDRGTVTTTVSTSYARYLDLQRWTTSFDLFAGFFERPLAVGEGDAARERRVGAVSASYFELFSARPALGRFFRADEDATPRGADVAVLSYRFWRSAYGARNVLGEALRVGDIAATIVGVAPGGFDGVNDADPPEIYIPITSYAASTDSSDARTYFMRYQWGWVNILARRRPGVSVTQAQTDATQAFTRSWEAAAPDDPRLPPALAARPRVAVSSVRLGGGPNPSLEARTALWLTGVAVMVLLIACANVANLVLARGLRRRREVAVRIALGVGRGRLLAQSLTEGMLLSVLGGVAALLVARWTAGAIQHLLLAGSPASPALVTDWRTLVVSIVAIVVAGVLIGAAPAVLHRGDLAQVLRGGARGGHADARHTRAALLLLQATLSVMLLVGAALFVRSLGAAESARIGYEPERVLLVNRVIRGQAFDAATHAAVRQALLEAARSLPSVESAAWISTAPFVNTSSTNLIVPGLGAADALGRFSYQATTPDYFATMGTRILRGRGLTPDDRAGAPDVAVVSDGMARVLWPQQDPIGKCFRMRAETAPCITVVGVAEDIAQRNLVDSERYHYYLSIDQYTRTWGNGLLVKVRGDAARESETIRAALQRAMPGASYVTVRLLHDLVRDQQRSWRLGARLFGYFGVLALVVAAIGLYGSIGYEVAHRMHELSVRVALGASRSNILALVVGRGLRLAGAGAIIGVVAAFGASRWVQPLLFEQSARDPLVYGGVAAAMLAVAAAASAVPALAASRADPNVALRAD